MFQLGWFNHQLSYICYRPLDVGAQREGPNPVQRHRELSPLRSRSVGAAAWGPPLGFFFLAGTRQGITFVIFVIPQRKSI